MCVPTLQKNVLPPSKGYLDLVKVGVEMVRKELVYLLYGKVSGNWLIRFQGGEEAQG
jgi:hypothetical protein